MGYCTHFTICPRSGRSLPEIYLMPALMPEIRTGRQAGRHRELGYRIYLVILLIYCLSQVYTFFTLVTENMKAKHKGGTRTDVYHCGQYELQ